MARLVRPSAPGLVGAALLLALAVPARAAADAPEDAHDGRDTLIGWIERIAGGPSDPADPAPATDAVAEGTAPAPRAAGNSLGPPATGGATGDPADAAPRARELLAFAAPSPATPADAPAQPDGAPPPAEPSPAPSIDAPARLDAAPAPAARADGAPQPGGPEGPAGSPGPDAPCPPAGDAVAVHTLKRELWLCRDGSRIGRFLVALGSGGVDKKRAGDRRTPLGTYVLGAPRPSGRFGIFIPIGYPTPEQASEGRSGGDLGIHGPPRGKAEPEWPTTAFDWTKGCVATGTDADVEVIASFVRERQPVVVIR